MKSFAKCLNCGREFERDCVAQKYCQPSCTPTEIKKRKKQYLIDTYGNICSYCGISLDGQITHVDHIKSRYSGGDDNIDNLALSCERCNIAKGADDAYGFLGWLDYIRSNEFNSPIINRLKQREL